LISIAVLLAARFAVSLVRRASRRGFAIGDDLKSKFPTLESRANRYLPILDDARRDVDLRLCVSCHLAGLERRGVLLVRYGFRAPSDQRTHQHRRRRPHRSRRLEIFSSAIERYLSAVDGTGHHVSRSARTRTLLPLLRTTVLVVLLALVTLIVLSEIGVDIAPLLAGAGVVGLAIGFGSQALVKDVITGLFILIEDTMAVGDVVDVGKGHSGVVEAISIRTISAARCCRGPSCGAFSEVTSVANLNQGLRLFRHQYRSFLSRGHRPCERGSGRGRGRDEGRSGIPPLLLEPLEIVGLDKMSELGVVLQVRMKTLPLRQWAVGREFNRRMKQEFDRNGIEMPYAIKPNYSRRACGGCRGSGAERAEAKPRPSRLRVPRPRPRRGRRSPAQGGQCGSENPARAKAPRSLAR